MGDPPIHDTIGHGLAQRCAPPSQAGRSSGMESMCSVIPELPPLTDHYSIDGESNGAVASGSDQSNPDARRVAS